MGEIRNLQNQCRGGRLINTSFKRVFLIITSLYRMMYAELERVWEFKRLFSHSSAEGGSFSALTLNLS